MSDSIHLKLCPKCGENIPAKAPQGLCPKCLLAQASIPTDLGKGALAKSLPPSHEALVAAFPQLEILELIGQGGMGFVFKARQLKLDRFVALKILPQSLAADPAFAERFAREGRVLARLNHPNIVTVHDFGQVGGFFYLLMEFVDGVNLRQAMKVGRFTPSQALAVAPKICKGLQFAHDEGILHRDIKPENILIDSKGRVKIADFGIAKLMGETLPDVQLTGTAGALGTAHYMAPEQVERPGTVDHRADIYSLGVVFYEMLTGELPLGKFPPPSRKVELDVRLDEVVLHALEKEPERRYQQAGQVRTDIETIAAAPGAPPKSGEPDFASGSRRPSERSLRFWKFLAAAMSIIALAAIFAAVRAGVAYGKSRTQTAPEATSSPAVLSPMIIDETPVRWRESEKGKYFGWNFKSLIPANQMAQMCLVFWSNGVPRIPPIFVGYIKIRDKPVVLDNQMIRCEAVGALTPGESNVVQWSFLPDFSFANGASFSNQPLYRKLDLAQQRLRVQSGRQLVVPLVEDTQSSGTNRVEWSGVELRVILQPLHSPVVQTTPEERDGITYVSGSGFAGVDSTADGVKLIEEIPEDRAETIRTDKHLSALEPLLPDDLREAKAKLAELRVTYGDASLFIQAQLARIKELERMTTEEPNLPPDLRAAKAELAEAKTKFGPMTPEIRGIEARIAELEQLSPKRPSPQQTTNSP